MLAAGEGTDQVTDFNFEDVLALLGGLTFEQLSIVQGVGGQAQDTLISLTDAEDVLAILKGVQADTIASTAFRSMSV
ncbi:MAG: hypothetical protein HC934_08230 [Acaryochloridaceae cyanobacterium SU_2_1]|nr:hypothetical protein [Acaryochloridaceae cyanobacterium SU_2_1]